MRLKRLVARGFKSFADRTEFDFDSRLTGIIGPNGCGKSNVVDAIKWVLGDQRAKSLRGTEMTDVIFKGAEGREAMGLAEVTITFEDPSASHDGRTEIDIGRRLSLDKESTYLLNGQEVRLKDVRDVLLDTGLGTGGYSVMEQGRIDAVLSANPEARRAIFEEAAGVSRFKLQKKEALRKLERTDQNLARVTDLLEERSRRIRSLRIQAGKARRFQELQSQLRDLRAAIAVVDGRELRGLIATQSAQLQELQTALQEADVARDTAAEELAEVDAAIASSTAALAAAQDALHACQSELLTHTERGRAQAQRVTELQAEAVRHRDRASTIAGQQQERHELLVEAREQMAGHEADLIELHRALGDQRQQVQAAQAELRRLQADRERLRQELLGFLHQRTRARNAAADQEAQANARQTRLLRVRERSQVLAGEHDQLAQAEALHGGQLDDQRTRERLLQEREQGVLADLKEADVAAAELAERESSLRRELSEVEGRQQALQAMEAHHEGLDAAPRIVLQEQPAGLRGRLLDLLEVDFAHSVALEAALGVYVQALVVDTRANAEAIVADLISRRQGRVLLLVEEEFVGEPGGPSLLPLPHGACFLLDLVRDTARSPAARRMLAWLLRGVVLVPSLAHADPSRTDLCFVTPEGTLHCGPRLEGGATAEGHAGLVVRRSQIQKLGEQTVEVRTRLEALQTGKDAAVGRVERLKAEMREVGAALAVVRKALHESEAQLARLRARGTDLQREQAELAQEEGDLVAARYRALAQLGRHLLDAHLIARREASATAGEAAAGDTIAAAQVEAETRARAEQELRVKQVQTGEAREGLVRAIRMHEQALAELERAQQQAQQQAEAAEAGAERATAEVERLHDLVVDLQARATTLERDKASCAQVVESVRQDRNRAVQVAADLELRRSSLGDQLNQLRLQLADTEHRFTRLEERLRDESEVELRRCLGEIDGIGIESHTAFPGPAAPADAVECLLGPPLPPTAVAAWYGLNRLWLQADFQPAEARKEVQVLQAQKDRLGAVNLDAVRELEDEEGQFTNLEQEVADLKEARKALMETLRKLEAESKALFEQTFAEARKNFQEIFRKLFQGGKADMFLTMLQEGDSMEAGIEIVAQPPGKQLQSINLLSGGERSLTAVAILFALFKVRPSPFCILDEVDAALDETNVERFLRVLRDFTGNTQFCIVTHHKRTMAECQVLYGITMQRRGISSRIAVALAEVDSFQEGVGTAAPAAAATAAAGRKGDPALKQRIAGEESVGF